jgi:small subunit ribosomal protein S4
MGRYTGPRNRLQRRLGMDLFLKSKPQKNLREYPPGMHGPAFRRKLSDFGLQLREKQKLKAIYGVFEKQFRRYFKIAARRPEATGTELLRILERRLDNVIYRSGLALTRPQGRQMVVHGAVRVNDHKVDRPSLQVSPEDVITLKVKPDRQKAIVEQFEGLKEQVGSDWLDINVKDLKSVVKRLPQRSDIKFPIEEQLVVELYSK